MKNRLITLMFALAIVGVSQAANDVALTRFYQYYNQLDPIQDIEANGMLNGTVAMFLMNNTIPIDQKAAVCNAFIAHNEMGNTASGYKQFIARKYRVDFKKLDLSQLKGEELFILGYLTMIDNKGNTSEALPILEQAKQKLPNSTTINAVLALATAQKLANSGQKCDAWKTIDQLSTATGLNNDMNKQVIDTIRAENNNLESACD